MKKKILLASIIALSLALLVAVGGTIAYLFVDTQDVVNTFTYGDINITLVESETAKDTDGKTDIREYKMIPGSTYPKDPKVTVLANSEKCWLFVTVTASNNVNNYLSYTIADGWNKYSEDVATGTTVYYRIVENSSSNQEFYIIKDNIVIVPNDVLKTDFANIDKNALPKLSFHADAVQYENVATVELAWSIAQNKGVPAAAN